MSGGFLYAQAQTDALSSSMTYRDWALIIHKTRCIAFLKATGREATGSWSSIQTGIQNEFMETVVIGSGVTSLIYIQDCHPVSIDTAKANPAFVSFFKHPTLNAEYCIITSNGFNSTTANAEYSSTNLKYGLYLGVNNVFHFGNYFACARSMMHAFSLNGFGSYNIGADAFLSNDSTFIYPSYSGDFSNGARHGGNASNCYGVVPTDSYSIMTGVGNSSWYGHSWVFGFAVRGTQIECFMKRMGQAYWLWSIIGEIVGIPYLESDTHRVGAIYLTNNSYDINPNFSTMNNLPYDSIYTYSLTNCLGEPILITSSSTSSYSRLLKFSGQNGACICARASNQTPNDVAWCAVPLGYSLNTSYTAPSSQSFDCQGSGFKGWVDTDMVRIVSPQVCQIAGATFGNGTLVSMYAGDAYHGYILGWDPSNPSIL